MVIELLLSSVTLVNIPPPIKDGKFPFAIHFTNKGSPWIINAYSEVELMVAYCCKTCENSYIGMFSSFRRSARAGW